MFVKNINLKKFKEIEWIIDLKKIFYFMKTSKVKMRFLVICVILSLGLTLFSMYTVSLLFPLAQGIIQGSFENVKSLSIIGSVVKKFPNFFNSSTKLFLLLVFWVYFTVIVKNILQYGAFLSAQYQAKVSTIKLRELLFERLLSFGKKFYDNNTVAYLHGILTKSTGAIEQQFSFLQKFIIQILLLCVYLSIMIYISWKLTIISIIIFPIISLFTKNIIKKIKEMSFEYSVVSTNLSNKVLNILYCMPLVKGYAKEDKEKDLFSKASEDELESSFKMQKVTNLVGPIEDVGTTTGILFVAIGLAWVLSFDHTLVAAKALIFFYLAMKIIPGLNALNEFKLGIARSAGQIKEIEYVLEDTDLFKVEEGNKEFAGIKNSIEIKNLNFSYTDDNKAVLKGLNFLIEKGKTTAIVGPTGSGKSTIANLILRFYDCPKGSIFVDGQDIKEFSVKSLRKHMAFVSQDNFLFNDTIKYNICYSNDENISEEKFNEVMKKTFVSDFVEKLPNRYDAIVGDRGVKLSGGEKQRLSIARALIKDPEILILDEPTSSLDSQTENNISRFVGEITRDKTVIVIAHRLSTIKNADRIVYIEGGKVIESGTIQELVDKKGAFFKQWEGQVL